MDRNPALVGSAKAEIKSLTGLRFFAAAAIVLWHSQIIRSPFQLDAAVTLFFVLSGFVLAISMSDEKPYADFLVGRVARIWPSHLAALLFLALVINPDTNYFWSNYWMSHGGQGPEWMIWLLVQAWVPHNTTYFSFNSVSWSLSNEIFFYVSFPICIFALKHRPAFRAGLFFLLTGLVVFATSKAFRSVDALWLGYINPATNLSVFAIGAAAGLISRKMQDSKLNFAWSSFLEIAALTLALCANAVFKSAHPHWASKGFLVFLSVSGGAPFYALLIFTLARYRGLVGRFLSLRPIVFLGEISFALYLFHQLVLKWRYAAPSTFYAGLLHIPQSWWIPAYWAVCLILSALCHLLVERPARRLILAGWRIIRQRRRLLSDGITRWSK